MKFGEAIRSGFHNYFNFRDRASRSAFWWWQLFVLSVSIVLSIIDGQFFGGKVDFEKILAENYDTLPEHEQAYIDGPVEELLRMADSYALSRTRKLPDHLFTFMAENGFFGMQMVSPSADLDADMLSALKAGNILYDEDANGAFFQFYSRPYAGGMFFEIVERRGGYAGYGAPNAPFRIAAQKRLMRPKGMPKK